MDRPDPVRYVYGGPQCVNFRSGPIIQVVPNGKPHLGEVPAAHGYSGVGDVPAASAIGPFVDRELRGRGVLHRHQGRDLAPIPTGVVHRDSDDVSTSEGVVVADGLTNGPTLLRPIPEVPENLQVAQEVGIIEGTRGVEHEHCFGVAVVDGRMQRSERIRSIGRSWSCLQYGELVALVRANDLVDEVEVVYSVREAAVHQGRVRDR